MFLIVKDIIQLYKVFWENYNIFCVATKEVRNNQKVPNYYRKSYLFVFYAVVVYRSEIKWYFYDRIMTGNMRAFNFCGNCVKHISEENVIYYV